MEIHHLRRHIRRYSLDNPSRDSLPDLVDHLLDGGQLQVFHDSLEVISLSGHVYGSKQGNSFHRLKRGRPPQSRNAMEEHVKFQ